MAFCEKCGHELPDGAMFCSNCGYPVPATTNVRVEHSKRKVTYEGEIYKCPFCGEILESFSVTCPTCGHEIRDSHISRAMREFTSKLEHLHSLEEKVELIRDFPITNTKEDVFEFIILASSNLAGNMPRALYEAWISKFEQSYQKAKVLFKNTSDFEIVQKIYNETQKKIRKDNLVQNAKSAQKKTSGAGSSIFTVILTNMGVFAGIFLLFWSIRIDRAHGNSSMHELVGEILLITSASILLRRDAHLYEYFITAIGGALSVYLSRFLTNGSMLELGGYIVMIITVIHFFRRVSYVNMKTKTRKPTSRHESEQGLEDTSYPDEPVIVPLSAFTYSEKNYEVVVSLFESVGFTNLKTVPLHDLRKGIIFRRAEEGTSDLVASIHINGKPLTIFQRKFSANVPVVISYHSFQD